jgi:hypothetical protein
VGKGHQGAQSGPGREHTLSRERQIGDVDDQLVAI